MPAKSKAQQQMMGAALSAKRGGNVKKGSPSAEIAKTMTAQQIKEFSGTKQKGLPPKVGEGKAPKSPNTPSRPVRKKVM